jgi:glutathione reductase (NADPH)
MAEFDVDLFVIGGGSGGVRAARVAAEYGARVAIAEENRWGGTCVIRGCVPKKLLVYASEVLHYLEDARGYGWTIGSARFSWPDFIAAKAREIARLSAVYVRRLQRANARLIEARARLVDAHTVEVGGERITAAHILIATGGAPKKPAGAWITSDDAFHLAELPRSIAILGSGYVAVEFAHIFAGFGVKTTLMHRGGVLRGFDPDVAEDVTRGLTAHGIAVVEGAPQGDFLRGADPTGHDLAMAAIGRAPRTADLGLEQAGVALNDQGGIVVDEFSRTNVPHIYAVGDVTQRVALTPVAIREAVAVVDTVFAGRPTPIHHDAIPTAVFAQPPAASVGLTEPAARAVYDVAIYRTRFRPMRHSLTGRDERVMIKLVVDRATDRVLGVHMVGPDAPEIIQTAAIAVAMRATKADFDRTFALHPTTAEELVLMRDPVR